MFLSTQLFDTISNNIRRRFCRYITSVSYQLTTSRRRRPFATSTIHPTSACQRSVVSWRLSPSDRISILLLWWPTWSDGCKTWTITFHKLRYPQWTIQVHLLSRALRVSENFRHHSERLGRHQTYLNLGLGTSPSCSCLKSLHPALQLLGLLIALLDRPAALHHPRFPLKLAALHPTHFDVVTWTSQALYNTTILLL